MKEIYRWARSLSYRRATNGWLGGVCAGFAQRTGIDVTLVRACTLLLLIPLSLGSVILLYVLAWVVLPDREDKIVLEKICGDPQPAASMASAMQENPSCSSGQTAPMPGSMGEKFEPASPGMNCAPEAASPGYTPSPTAETTSVPAPEAAYASSFADCASASQHQPQQPQPMQPQPAQAPLYASQPQSMHPPLMQPQPAYYDPQAVRHTKLPGVEPKRPPRCGPGSTLSLFVAGLLLIAMAIFLCAGLMGVLNASSASVFAVIAIAIICALGALVAHVRGRNGTWMTALASICAWGILLPVIPVYAIIPSGVRTELLDGDANVFSSQVITNPDGGFSHDFILGEMDLVLPEAEKVTAHSSYTVSGGIGEIRVRVPEGVQATIRPHVGIGEIQWDRADGDIFDPVGSCDAVFGLSSSDCSPIEQGGLTVGEGIPVTVNVDLSMGSIFVDARPDSGNITY